MNIVQQDSCQIRGSDQHGPGLREQQQRHRSNHKEAATHKQNGKEGYMREQIEKIDHSELMAMLGKGRTALYNLRMKDATFPKPIDHVPLRWIKSHIMAWIDSHNRIGNNA